MYPLPKQIRKLLFYAFLISLPINLPALQSDDQQTMHINADSSTFNYKTGTDIYEGNVKIDQGTTHLTADRVVTTKNSKHKIEQAVAYGFTHLAEYSTLLKPADPIFHAKAKIIKFFPTKSILFLEGDVVVTQGKNSFQGPVIIYNIKDQVITAPASKTGRATIIIDPNQLKT